MGNIEDCSDLHIVYYDDAACSNQMYSAVVNTTFQCQNNADIGTYLSSSMLMCTTGDSMVVPINSVVTK